MIRQIATWRHTAWYGLALVALAGLLAVGCAAPRPLETSKTNMYLYGDTRQLVDPAYPTIEGRDMTGLRDATGRPIVQELLQKLKTADTAWAQFLWPRPGEMLSSRKLMYMRKVQVGSETLLVGSDFYLATPVWMRV